MGMRGDQGHDGIPGPAGEKGETGGTCLLSLTTNFILDQNIKPSLL
jgi:hypothetical protein